MSLSNATILNSTVGPGSLPDVINFLDSIIGTVVLSIVDDILKQSPLPLPSGGGFSIVNPVIGYGPEDFCVAASLQPEGETTLF